jgi:hypothetical protein
MMKSAWGSDDPTKSAFPFLHGLALSEAGHSVQIFLLGEAVFPGLRHNRGQTRLLLQVKSATIHREMEPRRWFAK